MCLSPRYQLQVFIVLDHDAVHAGGALEQASGREKMLVEEAAVCCLDPAQLARIQNFEAQEIRRHTWTLA